MKQSEIERRRRFDALFEAHGPDIVACCSWRAGSPSDAQDAVADVFLTAWRRLDDVPREIRRVSGCMRRRERWSQTKDDQLAAVSRYRSV